MEGAKGMCLAIECLVQGLEQVEVLKGQCIGELTQFGVSCIVMVTEAGQRICGWGEFMGAGVEMVSRSQKSCQLSFSTYPTALSSMSRDALKLSLGISFARSSW